MLVIAHHFVEKPEIFWSSAQETISAIPSGLKLHSVFPSQDLKTGTCVWEANSVQDVQQFLDDRFSQVAKNVCYEVKEDIAIGLPNKAMQGVLQGQN